MWGKVLGKLELFVPHNDDNVSTFFSSEPTRYSRNMFAEETLVLSPSSPSAFLRYCFVEVAHPASLVSFAAGILFISLRLLLSISGGCINNIFALACVLYILRNFLSADHLRGWVHSLSFMLLVFAKSLSWHGNKRRRVAKKYSFSPLLSPHFSPRRHYISRKKNWPCGLFFLQQTAFFKQPVSSIVIFPPHF